MKNYRSFTRPINQLINLAKKILSPTRFQHCGASAPVAPAVPTPLLAVHFDSLPIAAAKDSDVNMTKLSKSRRTLRPAQ